MAKENLIYSVLKALSVLDSFSANQPMLRASEICRITGIPKTSLHRMLNTLIQCGLLEKNESTGKFKIGPKLYALGSTYLSTTDIIKAAQPVIKEINDLSGEAVSVGILERGNVILIMKEETRGAFRFASHVGSSFPAYASSMGKAFLSELTETEIDNLYRDEKLVPITMKTINTKTKLKIELEKIKEAGVSLDKEGLYEGVEGFSALMRDTWQKTVAALAISAPKSKMNEFTRKQLSTLVKLGANLISYRLGNHDMSNAISSVQELRSWWEKSGAATN